MCIVKKINMTKKEKSSNNNSKLIAICRNKYIIQFMLIISLINEVSSKINIHENFTSSEIVLKINEKGINNILYNEYINVEYPCPSLIYLNDEIQNLTNCSKINIST